MVCSNCVIWEFNKRTIYKGVSRKWGNHKGQCSSLGLGAVGATTVLCLKRPEEGAPESGDREVCGTLGQGTVIGQQSCRERTREKDSPPSLFFPPPFFWCSHWVIATRSQKARGTLMWPWGINQGREGWEWLRWPWEQTERHDTPSLLSP